VADTKSKPGPTPGPYRVGYGGSILATWDTGEIVQIALMSPTHWTGIHNPQGPKEIEADLRERRNEKRIHEETEHNAYLLAASWEMREALEDLLGGRWLIDGVCQHCGRDYRGETEPVTSCSDDCPGQKGRDALARSRGEL
jgi:hypothetical protein